MTDYVADDFAAINKAMQEKQAAEGRLPPVIEAALAPATGITEIVMYCRSCGKPRLRKLHEMLTRDNPVQSNNHVVMRSALAACGVCQEFLTVMIDQERGRTKLREMGNRL